MSRYLTPSKIGLLALISLYTESVIPSAATIPVLSFLTSHVLTTASRASQSESSLHSHVIPLAFNDFQKATVKYVSGIPGRNVWDLLLHKLWKIDSFDALHLFFDSLSSLLHGSLDQQQRELSMDKVNRNPNHILLSRASPLGSFVRKAQLEFARLPFHDSLTLWKLFVTFRAPSLLAWKRRNPSAGSMSFDANLRDEHLGWGDSLANLVYGGSEHQTNMSTEDAERLLDFQVDNMQSELRTLWLDHGLIHRIGTGNRLPHEMKARLQAMLESGITIPSLSHYVGYAKFVFLCNGLLILVQLPRCMEIWKLPFIL